ncbi:MAG TPA: RNA polymerase sigma factor, partial [Pseudomonadales bacterium]|nr:RNA polymerase sigma factor [Pseudomonadales bacterium]
NRSRAIHNAFLEAIEPYRAELWRYCRRLTGSPWDAEDLVQEALTRAFGALSLVWQPTEPRAYLFRVAANAWIDAMRRAERTRRRDLATIADASATTSDPNDAVADVDYVATSLPASQAAIVLLVDAFDFRIDEVADMLDVTPNAVKGALQRGRASLRTFADGPAPAVRRAPPSELVSRFIDAFNRRDIEAIASLHAVDSSADIVGVGVLRGRAIIHDDALSQWQVDPRPQRAEAGEFAGEPVVFVFEPADGGERLHRLDRYGERDGALHWVRTYYYTRELIAEAGAALGIGYATHPRITTG